MVHYLDCGDGLMTVYICVCVCVCVRMLSRFSRIQLFAKDPVDFRPPGSSVHAFLQARILEWVAIAFYKGGNELLTRPLRLVKQFSLYPSSPSIKI